MTIITDKEIINRAQHSCLQLIITLKLTLSPRVRTMILLFSLTSSAVQPIVPSELKVRQRPLHPFRTCFMMNARLESACNVYYVRRLYAFILPFGQKTITFEKSKCTTTVFKCFKVKAYFGDLTPGIYFNISIIFSQLNRK